MANEVKLTRAGYEKMKLELEELKGPVRMRVAEAIREAKSHGDLRENAAYHEAKLNQARLDSRIADLEKMFQLARVVEGGGSDEDVAQLGSKVVLLDLEFSDELEIMLVGSYEANPAEGLISITSPLGSSVLGQTPGQEVDVEAPGGTSRYRIVSVLAAES